MRPNLITLHNYQFNINHSLGLSGNATVIRARKIGTCWSVPVFVRVRLAANPCVSRKGFFIGQYAGSKQGGTAGHSKSSSLDWDGAFFIGECGLGNADCRCRCHRLTKSALPNPQSKTTGGIMAKEYTPSLEEVRALAKQGNVIAVHRELPADLETPVSVYLKLRWPGRGPGRDELSPRIGGEGRAAWTL